MAIPTATTTLGPTRGGYLTPTSPQRGNPNSFRGSTTMTHLFGAIAALPRPLGIAAVLRDAGCILQRLIASYIDYRMRRQTIAALSALDNHMLKDLGIARGNIEFLANTNVPPRPAADSARSIVTAMLITLLAVILIFSASAAVAAEIPASIATGETHVVTVHAEGAQVYECKAGTNGALAWSFREPIATLLLDGKTVGRHYAGPNWEWQDGSVVAAKASGRAPGATAKDIPLLKLEVTTGRGSGMLEGVTTIQRLNTQGGFAEGACPAAGAFLSVPYAADYAFYRKARAVQN